MAETSFFDEQHVLHRLKVGDIDAFNATYWQYHGAIYRNILRFTKNEDTAADLLQDVFVKLWEKRDTLQPGKSISGLLFVISYHLTVNHSKKALRELLAKSELSLHQSVVDSSEEASDLESQHELLERAIAGLTEQKQLVFTRCKLEGKSYGEVARELGISKHTVKEHLSIAMKTVKTYIRQNGRDLLAIGLLTFLDCWG